MNEPVLWIHGDNLNPHSAALQQYPDAPAVWVWDDSLLAQWRISLKRIVFLYECLLELPVEIRHGDVSAELLAFARRHNTTRIVTMESPSPQFAHICGALRAAGLSVTVVEEAPFVAPAQPPDLRRFSRYWRAVKDDAMRHSAETHRNR